MILLLKFILFLLLVLASKSYIKANLNRIEWTTFLFYNVCLTLLMYKFVSLNTKWYKVKENLLLVVTSDIDRILILPYLTLLLFIVIKKMSLTYKIMACGAWLMVLPFLEHINKWTGVVEFEKWGLPSSVIESTILLVGSLTFIFWYYSFKVVKHDGK